MKQLHGVVWMAWFLKKTALVIINYNQNTSKVKYLESLSRAYSYCNRDGWISSWKPELAPVGKNVMDFWTGMSRELWNSLC